MSLYDRSEYLRLCVFVDVKASFSRLDNCASLLDPIGGLPSPYSLICGVKSLNLAISRNNVLKISQRIDHPSKHMLNVLMTAH